MKKNLLPVYILILITTGCRNSVPKPHVPCVNPEIIVTPSERSDLDGSVKNLDIIIGGSHYYGWVYLPEEFSANDPKQQIPVLYFLSGMRNATFAFQGYDQQKVIDDCFKNGCSPFIYAALPCADYYMEFEDFFIHHFIPLARNEFHASSREKENAVGGISSGGDLASRMFFKYPGLFSVLGQHSAAITGEDLPQWESNLRKRRGIKSDAFYFDVGEEDPLFEIYTRLQPILDKLCPDYEYHTAPGNHSGYYWFGEFPAYIKWYSAKLH